MVIFHSYVSLPEGRSKMVIFKISALAWNNCGKRNVKQLSTRNMANVKCQMSNQSALKWSINIFEHPFFPSTSLVLSKAPARCSSLADLEQWEMCPRRFAMGCWPVQRVPRGSWLCKARLVRSGWWMDGFQKVLRVISEFVEFLKICLRLLKFSFSCFFWR